MATYSYIWQFQVAADRVADFERHYAPGGSWTDLFALGRGYVGTALLKDRTDPLRYVTIDTWQSVEAYLDFRASYEAQYRALDAVCAGFTTSEIALGEFSGVASNLSSLIHHISLGVQSIEDAARFYDAVLAPLGYVRVWSDLRPGGEGQAVGYGSNGSDDRLAIKQVATAVPDIPGFHLAFTAATRADVTAFHQAALRAGGRDNGPPGLRPDYGPGYFAAFVIDPDGYRLEAVCKAT